MDNQPGLGKIFARDINRDRRGRDEEGRKGVDN
jgi:hypothetical protein